MDCEPTTATSHPAATGPGTWDAGEERSALRDRRPIWPTCHVVCPSSSRASGNAARALHNGACLGPLHPEILAVATRRAQIAHYADCGRRAERVTWRVKPFGPSPSAISRDTPPRHLLGQRCNISVLEARTRGGSCTAPGRLIPEIGTGGGRSSPRQCDLRHARGSQLCQHATFALIFQTVGGPAGRSMYADPTRCGLAAYDVSYRTIATNIVKQLRELHRKLQFSIPSRTTNMPTATPPIRFIAA